MSVVHLPDTLTIGGAGSTITLPSGAGTGSVMVSNGTASSWASASTTISNSGSFGDSKVLLNNDGVHIKEGADLTIGGASLSDFMRKVEDRLGILRPNEGLEERWEELKNLRRQYEALEKDLLEKEKIMEILKDKNGS